MPAKKEKQLSYQELRARLDTIILQLQGPDCDVDQAADLYEQALVIIRQMEQHLAAAENRIQKIKADFTAGGNGAA